MTEDLLEPGVSPEAGLLVARQQLQFARRYVRTLIDGVPDDQWFACPPGCPTHLAWQVGHLTMAQYMLTLVRLRGKADGDGDLVPRAFLKLFAKTTQPQADASKYPSVGEIRQSFDAVERQVFREWPEPNDPALAARVMEPYIAYPNWVGSVLFAANHGMLHAGQIGLWRRLLGYAPVR